MNRLFSNAILVSKINKYLNDHEQLYFDVFLRGYHALNENIKYQLTKKTFDNKPIKEIEKLSKLLLRSIDEYKIERNEFITNQIKFRELLYNYNKLNNQLIYKKLLLNNYLFGDRLKFDYWNDRYELALKITTIYRGNIQLYLQHNRLLREKYIKLKNDSIQLLNSNNNISKNVLNDINNQTINILKDIFNNNSNELIDNSIDHNTNANLNDSTYNNDTINSIVNNIVLSYEENTSNLIKQNEKWRNNHIRKILRDIPTTSNTASNTNDSDNTKQSSQITDEKIQSYRNSSLEKSREFTKHMVDVVERCVIRVIDNCDKKVSLLKSLKDDINLKTNVKKETSENDAFSNKHIDDINNKFNTKLISKLNDLSTLQQKLVSKHENNSKKLLDLFQSV